MSQGVRGLFYSRYNGVTRPKRQRQC